VQAEQPHHPAIDHDRVAIAHMDHHALDPCRGRRRRRRRREESQGKGRYPGSHAVASQVFADDDKVSIDSNKSWKILGRMSTVVNSIVAF
jgi:hypothetical protein